MEEREDEGMLEEVAAEKGESCVGSRSIGCPGTSSWVGLRDDDADLLPVVTGDAVPPAASTTILASSALRRLPLPSTSSMLSHSDTGRLDSPTSAAPSSSSAPDSDAAGEGGLDDDFGKGAKGEASGAEACVYPPCERMRDV